VLLVLGLFVVPIQSVNAQSAVYLPSFTGGATRSAVFANPGFFDAARGCAEKFPYKSNPEHSGQLQTDCLAAFMKLHDAGSQAIAFMRFAPAPAAISELRRFGPVSVAHADMMWADAADGWALIGDSGDVVPLWDVSILQHQSLYKAFLKRHPDAIPWSDSLSWPHARTAENGDETLTFDYTLKNCRACAILGHASVTYFFTAQGKFSHVELTRITSIPAKVNERYNNWPFSQISLESYCRV
jgi:hypothetical protein